MPAVSFVPLRILPSATFTFPACPNCKTKVLRAAPNLLSCPRCRSHYPDAKISPRFRIRATVLCGALQTKVTLFGGRLNAVFGMTACAFETLLAATDALPDSGILDALAHILVGTRIEASVSARFMKRFKSSQLGPEVLEALASAGSGGGGGGGTLVGLADDALINSFRVLNVRRTVLDLLCPALSTREDHYGAQSAGSAARWTYRQVVTRALLHKWDFGRHPSLASTDTTPKGDWPDPWVKPESPLVFETVPIERFLTEELKLRLEPLVLPDEPAVLPPAAEPVEACAPSNSAQTDPSDSLASQLNALDLNDNNDSDNDDETIPESPELIGHGIVTQQTVAQAMSAISLQDNTVHDDDDESVPSSPELIGTRPVARQTAAQAGPVVTATQDMLAMLLDGLNLDNNDTFTPTQPAPQHHPAVTQRSNARTPAPPRRTVLPAPTPKPSQDAMLAVLLDGFSLDGDETFMADTRGASSRTGAGGGGQHSMQTTTTTATASSRRNAPSQRNGETAASQTFYGTQTFYGDDSELDALVDRLALDGHNGF
ncbi:hypothetical protein HDU87_004666 [Geranomyces variabilis]|uniref:Uncharacterized protein n=1 Tax=Geranomyces variabilis TaxID=109894 RepID=A0AAD5TKL4_9FUNG|nr:hypothetical protein HDU87_004666 [Geranomyces variabilis]